jgi:hypothetical protein
MWGQLRWVAGICALVFAVAVGYGAAVDHPGDSRAARLGLLGPGMKLSNAINVAPRELRLESVKLPGGVSRGTLESIAECESHGDPKAVSSDGTYRGKYQFDSGTWESVGGKGDPASAPEGEQDVRAALLYKRTGPTAWPVCG